VTLIEFIQKLPNLEVGNVRKADHHHQTRLNVGTIAKVRKHEIKTIAQRGIVSGIGRSGQTAIIRDWFTIWRHRKDPPRESSGKGSWNTKNHAKSPLSLPSGPSLSPAVHRLAIPVNTLSKSQEGLIGRKVNKGEKRGKGPS